MNYYDEEIIIAGPDTKNLSAVKVNRMPSGSEGVSGSVSGSGRGNRDANENIAGSAAAGRRSNHVRQRGMAHSNDDDGLLQDIIDHDDEDDTDDDDDDDSDMQKPSVSNQQIRRSSATVQRPTSVRRPTSTRYGNLPTAKIMDNDSENSDTESDEGLGVTDIASDAISGVSAVNSGVGSATAAFNFLPPRSRIPSTASATPLTKQLSTINDETTTTTQLNITPDKWQQLDVHEEIKELFPYILKYTPQTIAVPFHLQPFIPEYVPACGDVDAFLKVTTPPLNSTRQHEINEHINKLGLYVLDEPAGVQSQPSILNMKLRSVLTGSGVNPRSASAALIPTAKSPKDIDKWIGEVEQVHMTQSVNDVQPRRDIEPLLMDWPREFAMAEAGVQNAYQRCLQEDITLAEYVSILSERFGVEGPLETQADYILNVQTLFALYLAANQAWE